MRIYAVEAITKRLLKLDFIHFGETCFHLHAQTVMLAYIFLVWLEFRGSKGRQRGGFHRVAFPRRRDTWRVSLPEVPSGHG